MRVSTINFLAIIYGADDFQYRSYINKQASPYTRYEHIFFNRVSTSITNDYVHVCIYIFIYI